ncbi:response regulator [Leptolyngbya iicbica]|uniref:DNA-binding response regulator n=2 Tax=Cyanophyceae TaxID=3028117 RepID=A0A4Q7E850_9CYAN|nr:response regulator transcription factor [Leptolyngbya sp. LK]RZM78708.1 DNA-binding response regulator [Leptolyngbya sp. LK]
MSPLKIVLIEDHELTRMGLKVAFQQQPNFNLVGESGTGLGGLSLLNQYQPDVAIVDIGLPDIDGIELIRRFRKMNADQETFSTKILMLTMNDSEDAVMEAFTAGADSYCMKQADIQELIVAVNETHAGYPYIDPAIASIVLQHLRRTPVSVPEDQGLTVSINAINTEYQQLLDNFPLTERELEILEMIVEGYRNAEIAERSHITIGTVKTHVRNILNKLGVDDRTKAAVWALRAGLVN